MRAKRSFRDGRHAGSRKRTVADVQLVVLRELLVEGCHVLQDRGVGKLALQSCDVDALDELVSQVCDVAAVDEFVRQVDDVAAVDEFVRQACDIAAVDD